MESTAHIKSIISTHWLNNKSPLLISSLGAEVKRNDTLKRSIGDKKLKLWILENIDNLDAKLVQHPKQKEKMGLIPSDTTYQFPEDDIINTAEAAGNNALVDLMKIISKLPKEDIDRIVIPTSALCKLLVMK